jgi:hypothetical protein
MILKILFYVLSMKAYIPGKAFQTASSLISLGVDLNCPLTNSWMQLLLTIFTD